MKCIPVPSRLSVLALVALAAACGAPEQEPAAESSLRTSQSALTVDCDTSTTVPFMGNGAVEGNYYIRDEPFFATCPVPDGYSRRWIYLTVYMGSCWSADGTGCPKLEVYDGNGDWVRTFTEFSAGTYLRIPVPSSSKSFRIKSYQPTWISSSQSYEIKGLSW